jgi:hypothetical protein
MFKRMAEHAGKGTIVGTMVGTGIGAASFYGATKLAEKVTWFQGRWWAAPAALVIAGHVAKRWSNPTGQAAVGAGGALLAMSYYVQAQSGASAAPPAKGFYGYGYGEAAGTYDNPDNMMTGGYGAGALMRPSNPASPGANPPGTTFVRERRRSEAGALMS